MAETEKRAARRADVEVNVDFESDHNFYTGLTQNISAGGLFVATHQLRKVGERLQLIFTVPNDHRSVAVAAEVRWLRETSALHKPDGATGMGLRFVDLSPEAAASIRMFMNDRDSLYYDDEV